MCVHMLVHIEKQRTERASQEYGIVYSNIEVIFEKKIVSYIMSKCCFNSLTAACIYIYAAIELWADHRVHIFMLWDVLTADTYHRGYTALLWLQPLEFI